MRVMSRAALATVVVAVVALVLPAPITAGPDGSITLALTALALVLVAVAAMGPGLGALVAGSVIPLPVAAGETPPTLTGRATDPIHHPLRPRAPGPC